MQRVSAIIVAVRRRFMDAGNVIFFGTTDFSAAVLETLVQEGYHIGAVVTQPDKPVGRKHKLEASEVKQYALAHGIPVLQPVRLTQEADSVLSLHPDLIISCAYGQLIPVSILEAPKYGCLNIHPSKLPRYRGGAPIQRAVMNGDTETEVCLMEIAAGMDSGVVYARIPAEIGPDETSSELFEQLKEPACELIRSYLPRYLSGELKGEVQDEAGVVLAPNIRREEEQVFFQKEPIRNLYNHLRGLMDTPLGYGMIDGKRIKIARARIEETQVDEVPGTILGFADHAMRVAGIGGVLLVYELQMEGKSRMDADAFRNGSGRQLIGKVFD